MMFRNDVIPLPSAILVYGDLILELDSSSVPMTKNIGAIPSGSIAARSSPEIPNKAVVSDSSTPFSSWTDTLWAIWKVCEDVRTGVGRKTGAGAVKAEGWGDQEKKTGKWDFLRVL